MSSKRPLVVKIQPKVKSQESLSEQQPEASNAQQETRDFLVETRTAASLSSSRNKGKQPKKKPLSGSAQRDPLVSMGNQPIKGETADQSGSISNHQSQSKSIKAVKSPDKPSSLDVTEKLVLGLSRESYECMM